MIRTLLSSLLLVFLLSACAERTAPDPEATAPIEVPPADHPDSSTWADLFAPDFSNALNADTVWSFQDGVLTASHDVNIYTTDTYDNFILDLEYQVASHTNSGVIVYASNLEDWTHYSLEIQIADNYDAERTEPPTMFENGSIFGHQAPSVQTVLPVGEWNRMTVTCQGQNVWVMINGVMVNELDMALFTSGEVNPDGSEIPEWLSVPLAELPTSGHIGLQGKHGDADIFFRNVKINVLE